MKRNNLITDFTSGNIAKQLTVFMLPFVASFGLQVLYSIIDMIIVGRYVGTSAISGVSQGGMLTLFATIFCLGFSNSGQTLFAQSLGAGKTKEFNQIIGTTFTVTACMGIATCFLLVTFRAPLLTFLNIPPEASKMADNYVMICGCGLIFNHMYNTVSAILRGLGDSKHPFIFITISSVLNLLLDLLFTGRLGLGVAAPQRQLF